MKPILVIGGTGAMGRPVVEQLLRSERERWSVRVLTRDVASPEANTLRALDPSRVDLREGTVGDPATLEAAMKGVHGVFCNTNFFATASVEGEYGEGVAALEAARKAGVAHFVYSSLDSLGALSSGELPCPHFDAKAAVETYIDRRRSDEFMRRGLGDPTAGTFYLERTTVLVTAPYYENLKAFFRPYPIEGADGEHRMLLRLPFGASSWPMVALADIGWFAVHAFENAGTFAGRTLRIASQSVSGADIASAFERATGIPASYDPMPMAEYESLPIPLKHDFVNMVKAINAHGLPRDFDRLRAIHPGLVTLEGWIKKTGWRGEPEDFMKSAREQR